MPLVFNDKWDAKKLRNFLWHMERFVEAIALVNEATKMRIVTPYLTNVISQWWAHAQYTLGGF